MTKEQIAELRRLEGDAFAPPWALNRGANGEVLSIDSVRGEPPGTQYVFGPVDEPPLFDSDSAEFVVAARNILGRLLDEREALLEALHGLIEFANSPAAKAVDMSAWVHGVRYRPEDVAAWDVARAAIAKAEAE